MFCNGILAITRLVDGRVGKVPFVRLSSIALSIVLGQANEF